MATTARQQYEQRLTDLRNKAQGIVNQYVALETTYGSLKIQVRRDLRLPDPVLRFYCAAILQPQFVTRYEAYVDPKWKSDGWTEGQDVCPKWQAWFEEVREAGIMLNDKADEEELSDEELESLDNMLLAAQEKMERVERALAIIQVPPTLHDKGRPDEAIQQDWNSLCVEIDKAEESLPIAICDVLSAGWGYEIDTISNAARNLFKYTPSNTEEWNLYLPPADLDLDAIHTMPRHQERLERNYANVPLYSAMVIDDPDQRPKPQLTSKWDLRVLNWWGAMPQLEPLVHGTADQALDRYNAEWDRFEGQEPAGIVPMPSITLQLAELLDESTIDLNAVYSDSRNTMCTRIIRLNIQAFFLRAFGCDFQFVNEGGLSVVKYQMDETYDRRAAILKQLKRKEAKRWVSDKVKARMEAEQKGGLLVEIQTAVEELIQIIEDAPL